jgi:hypothetical protein
MFTTEFFAFLARSAKDKGTPDGDSGVCAAGFEIGSRSVAIPKPAIRQITVHPIKVVFLNIPFFLDISYTIPSLRLIISSTLH